MSVRITIDKEINFNKLILELANAGFTQTSSIPNEVIIVENTDDTDAVMAIYNAHSTLPTPEEVEKELSHSIQLYMDSVAQTRRYDDCRSCISYKDSTVPQWSSEAVAMIEWRDAVLLYCYQVMTDVKNNQRPIPTIDELIAELPVINW